MKFELSIVILSFNVRELLLACLESVYADPASKNWQVIVVDNASRDNSAAAVAERFPQVELIRAKLNLGFAAGNNLARPKIKSERVLFLNPDTRIVDRAISKTLPKLDGAEVGAVTCRVELPDGELDYSCHRGLPTPWNALCYFSGLAKWQPKSKWLAGYTATYLDIKVQHEIDCATGAFLMVKKDLLDEFGWWDEDYFWNGEDIEMCYQIRHRNYKIIFFPEAKIIHYKGSSSGLWKTGAVRVDPETVRRSKKAGVQAMRIFFGKHYGRNWLVSAGINVLERIRLAGI